MKKDIIHIRENKEKLNYIVYTPKAVTVNMPMIVFLHGAGERGTDIEHISKHGIPKLIEEGTDINAIVLCPQCHEKFVWNNVVEELKHLINKIADKYSVDKSGISITGGSMGGFGTWEMGMTYPNFFSAIAPICGGGLSWRASNLSKTPVFAFHGKKDDIVPLIYSNLMVDAVNKIGGSATLTIFEELGHNDAIDMAYRNTPLISQLLSAKRTDFSEVKEAFSEWF